MTSPFTTVWIEFGTVGQALKYYNTCPYPCRISPQCERSIDIKVDGCTVPTGELHNLSGVAKRPQMFVLDPSDCLWFVPIEARSPLQSLAA